METDIKLSHFSAGKGKNILVVHGGPGAPDVMPWSGLQSLTEAYQFHYYAQRGCGGSSRPIDKFESSNFYRNMKTLERTLGLGAQVADIERIRQILGEDKLTLIGHSFGGFLASIYAAEFPERVARLVLVAPADVLVLPNDRGGLYEAVRKKLPEDMQAEYSAYLDALFDFKTLFRKSESDLARFNQTFARYYARATQTKIPHHDQPGQFGQVVDAFLQSS